jgi:hypothetical protein
MVGRKVGRYGDKILFCLDDSRGIKNAQGDGLVYYWGFDDAKNTIFTRGINNAA